MLEGLGDGGLPEEAVVDLPADISQNAQSTCYSHRLRGGQVTVATKGCDELGQLADVLVQGDAMI